jgi:hypothetical protein
MEPEKPESELTTFLSELRSWELVAFLGLLMYITTLGFEYGVAAYWGFSRELVSFSPENAFGVFLALVMIAVAIWMIYTFFPKPKSNKVQLIVYMSGYITVAAVIFFFLRPRMTMLGDYASNLMWLSFVASYLTMTILLVDRAKVMSAFIPRAILVYIFCLTAIPWFAVGAGYYLAGRQHEFIVIDRQPPTVVLRRYGSDYVTAVLRGDGALEKGFRVIELSDVTETLTMRKVRPKPAANP